MLASRLFVRLVVSAALLLLVSPLNAEIQTEMSVATPAVRAAYDFGECETIDGVCYQPLRVTLDRHPDAFEPKADEPVKLWRIDGKTGAETYFEFDRADAPEFIPQDWMDAEANEAPPSFKNNIRTAIDETDEYPYSSVLKLYMQVPGTQYGAVCSGMMAGATNVALTAGHCVYSNDADQGIPEGALDVMYVIPGMNGEVHPFGIASDEELWVPDAWKSGGNNAFNYDWAVLRLNRDVGERTHWMTLVADNVSDNYFYGETIHVLGYPGDLRDGEYMYHVQGNFLGVSGNVLYHDAYVYQGNSGGPTYINTGATNPYQIVGIVSHSTYYAGREVTGSTMIKSAVTTALREAADCGNGCAVGERECVNGTNYRECITNSYGCNVWSWNTVCVGGKVCVNDGQCTGGCEHTCTEGKKTCGSDTGVSVCEVGNEGCWVWSEPEECARGEVCDGGECVDGPADGDIPVDGDTPADCSGSCQPGADAFCVSSMVLCECRAMQWTLSDCSLYCLEDGMTLKGCSYHPGQQAEVCLCQDHDTPVDGDAPDGDDSDDDGDGKGMTVGNGGCRQSGNGPLWGLGLLLLVWGGLIRRRVTG